MTTAMTAAQVQRLEHLESHARKRVGKACDRCRLKKAGCTEGDGPCKRCVQDNESCTYTERQPNKEKTYTNMQAQYLEQTNDQMKAGLIKMFQMLDQQNLWNAPRVSKASDGSPSIHDILEGLGVINKVIARRVSTHSLCSDDYEPIPERPHKRARSNSYEDRHSIDTSVPALVHAESPETTPTMTVPMMANTGLFSTYSSPTPAQVLPAKRQRMSNLEVPIFNPEAAMTYSEPLMIDMNSDFLSPSSSPSDFVMYGGAASAFMFTDNTTTTGAMFDSTQAPTNPFLDLGFSSEFGLESLSRTISSN